jgi:cobalt-precorrin-5B (C1)-methyltransferase
LKKGSKAFKKGTRTGFTTGACAAAAARGAALALGEGTVPAQVETLLPNGQTVLFPVADGWLKGDEAQVVIIKDAGDDPDCTHGARLTAHLRLLPESPGEIQILGGSGVGRVTRPGVGLEVGKAAINPIPRENILENVQLVANHLLETSGLQVTILVPGGENMAKGGISILGTGGIVHPYSTSAYKASVKQAVQAAEALKVETLVFTTGRRTERFAMAQLPQLPDYSFIQMGDFFGAAMDAAHQAQIPQVLVAAMVGKLAKIGQGIENTHAHKTPLDMKRVARLALTVGASKEISDLVAQGVTVRHGADLLSQQGLEEPFYGILAQGAVEAMVSRLPKKSRAKVLAFDFEGKLLAEKRGETHG